jgi:hypothetical protein
MMMRVGELCEVRIGLCGSQKYTFTLVTTVNFLWPAISNLRSHVSERRRLIGIWRSLSLRRAGYHLRADYLPELRVDSGETTVTWRMSPTRT